MEADGSGGLFSEMMEPLARNLEKLVKLELKNFEKEIKHNGHKSKV